MSASAWATARIARAMPPSVQPAGLVADGAQLPRRHADLAGQVGVAHAPRRGLVAGQAARAAGERPGDQHRRGAAVERPAQLLERRGAAPAERGVGDRERLGLGPAAEVLLDLLDRSAARRRSRWPAGRPRPPATAGPARRPGPGRSAASGSIARRGARTSAATKPGYSRGPQLRRLHLGDGGELAQLGEHAAALRPAAVHQHQRDVVGRARRRSRAGRRRTPRAGPPGPRTTTQRVAENSDGAASSPSAASVRSAAAVSENSASASWARTAARTPTTVRSAEELLLAGHQRDPAEDVCAAEPGGACHGAAQPVTRPPTVTGCTSRPGPTTTATSPSRSVRQHPRAGRRQRRERSRPRGGRSRCPRPPRPPPAGRRASASQSRSW